MNPLNLLLLIIALQTAPVEGPISDMIGNRVDKLATRVEAWKVETEQAHQSRFAEMMQAIADARNERKTILDSIQELKGHRDGLFSELAEFKKEREGLLARMADVRGEQVGIVGRLENLRERFDQVDKRWTPLQNVVDRLIGLVWKLFWLMLSVLVVTVVVGSILLFLYVRLKSKLMKLAFSTEK